MMAVLEGHMAAVLKLVQRRSNAESEQITRWLASEMDKGRTFDYLGVFRDDKGVEHMVATGIYKRDLAHAVLAAVRIKNRLAEGDGYA
jgi:hypothetical protein